MPTYSYQCDVCQKKFERYQAITAEPLTQCPDCGGAIRRIITGGAGFMIKGPGTSSNGSRAGCQFESTGTTCCGRQERCQIPGCGDKY